MSQKAEDKYRKKTPKSEQGTAQAEEQPTKSLRPNVWRGSFAGRSPIVLSSRGVVTSVSIARTLPGDTH